MCDKDFFLGICFLLSAYSKDKVQKSCLVVKNRRIISSGFSCTDLLGETRGSAERFAFSNLESIEGCDVYINCTPSIGTFLCLEGADFNKLVYFKTHDLILEAANIDLSKLVRFDGNLNWIRDHVTLMKGFDIFA